SSSLGLFGVLVLLTVLAALLGQADAAKKPGAERRASTSTASERLGAVDAWTAYAYKEKSGQVCYLVGEPQKSESAGVKRKPPTALITHRPGEKTVNVVSFVEGYPLKEGSEVSLDVGGAKFELFIKNDSAWARTAQLDKSIVEAMARAKQAVVKGI